MFLFITFFKMSVESNIVATSAVSEGYARQNDLIIFILLDDDQHVDPFNVKAGAKGIDYDKSNIYFVLYLNLFCAD